MVKHMGEFAVSVSLAMAQSDASKREYQNFGRHMPQRVANKRIGNQNGIPYAFIITYSNIYIYMYII